MLETRKIITESFKTFLHSCKKIAEFLTSHRESLGYYTALSLILLALGTAAYGYRSHGTDLPKPTVSADFESGIAVHAQPDPTLPPEETSPKYVRPVRGSILKPYMENELVWSETLQMWQTHPAIDIAASLGEEVVSAADGVVLEVYSDPLYGNTIVIDHGEGEIVRYKSLNTLQLVQVGQSVAQGEIISSAGTCTAETELGAHIHLEYSTNQSYADFSLCFEDWASETLQE